ncbi:MAG: iron-sulfur cluster assembly accessory protein [Peptococcaceae bacterium]|nr:iron-sulfur cluster assembly accessory protein [Peptococcaceae bacterium]
MVSITEAAAGKINEIKAEQNKPDAYLRLYVSGFGCGGPAFGITLDENKGENDNLDEGFGISIVADKKLESFLEGAVVDYSEENEGAGFEIKTDRQKDSCGGNCQCCG